MVERLRQYRDSGLGEPAAHGSPALDHSIEAARSVLAEARAPHEYVVSGSANLSRDQL